MNNQTRVKEIGADENFPMSGKGEMKERETKRKKRKTEIEKKRKGQKQLDMSERERWSRREYYGKVDLNERNGVRETDKKEKERNNPNIERE